MDPREHMYRNKVKKAISDRMLAACDQTHDSMMADRPDWMSEDEFEETFNEILEAVCKDWAKSPPEY